MAIVDRSSRQRPYQDPVAILIAARTSKLSRQVHEILIPEFSFDNSFIQPGNPTASAAPSAKHLLAVKTYPNGSR